MGDEQEPQGQGIQRNGGDDDGKGEARPAEGDEDAAEEEQAMTPDCPERIPYDADEESPNDEALQDSWESGDEREIACDAP